MSIISDPPYYDHYEKYKEENKNYTQLLARPGRVAQSREFNEIQSTLKDIIRSLGDSMMKDGDIIEGCQVIPDKTKNRITVTEGKIYIKGMVLPVPLTVLDNISIPEGRSVVGVELKEKVVTATTDDTLRDPAIGSGNERQLGCDRLQSELEISLKRKSEADSSLAILAELNDGGLYLSQTGPNYSVLNETLARRTYDESGSYIVEGLTVRVEENPDDLNTFYVVVESGKAYVHGYEITRPSAQRLIVNRSITTTKIDQQYQSDGKDILLTTGPHVESITEVKGSLLEENDAVIVNNRVGTLRQSTGHSISRVYDSKTKELIASNRYTIQLNPARIVFLDDDHPIEILVDYYYHYVFRKDIDYDLYRHNENSNEEYNYNSDYLRWLDTGSSINPVIVDSDTASKHQIFVNVEYKRYKARRDTVYIDEAGEISVIEGIPTTDGFENSPSAPSYTLPLATIKSPPGGLVDISDVDRNITVSNVGLTRFTMNDIHRLLNRIKTVEYDQAILSLNIEAKNASDYDMKGLFTDPFIDLSKIDMNFNLLTKEGDRLYYNATIDISSNMVYLPLKSRFEDLVYSKGEETTVSTYDSVATLEIEGESRVVLSQDKATGSFLIAPYVAYRQLPEVSISPSLDTWYDDTIIEIPESINTEKLVSTSSNLINMIDFDPSWHGANVYHTSTKSSTTFSAIGTNVEKVIDEDIISENATTYLRSREIVAEGYNYQPGAQDIECFIDGMRVNLYPVIGSGTVASTISGAIHADSTGYFKATFTIPEGKILSGTRLVTFKTAVDPGYENSASTFYQGIGIERTIKRTITTITTVLKHRADTTTVTKTYYDPLAQTFVLDNMTLLSGVNVYFNSVPAGNVPVTCEIREVQDGDIKSTVYGFKTLTADEIRNNISKDGSKPTTFKFKNPVLIEANREYAFVLRSTSTDYSVFVAEIGSKIIGSDGYPTEEIVMNNPYLQGVMMSSSNNSSWTIHQKTDIKFDLLSDDYATESKIVFEDIHIPEGFCRVNLSAESIIFNNTDIKWEYSTNRGINKYPITPYTPIVLKDLAVDFRLEATLSRLTNTSLTPILALDSVSIYTNKYDNPKDDENKENYYISKLISGLDPYNTVEIILDTYEVHSGTSLEVFVSPSNNNANDYSMIKAELQHYKSLSGNWVQKTYKATLPSKATQCRLFVKLNSSNEYTSPAFRRLRSIMSLV